MTPSDTSRTSAEMGLFPETTRMPVLSFTCATLTRVGDDRLASDGPQESGHPLLGRDGEQEAGAFSAPRTVTV